MAEKKSYFGKWTLLAVAAGAAAGVLSYVKREEIKRLAEDLAAKVKTAGDEDIWDEPEDELEEEAEELVDIVIAAEEEAEAALEDAADVIVEITVEPDEAEAEDAGE